MAKHLRWIVGWMQLWAYAIGMGCMLCVGLTAILDPLLIKWIIDVGLPRREPLAVIVAAVGVCVIYVGRSALNWLAGWTTFRANQNMVLKMQFALIERLQAFSAEWFDSTPGGDTLFRVQQDVQQIGELSSALLTAVVRSIILALITLGAMLMLNVRLALLVLLLAPVFVQLCRRNRRTLNELLGVGTKSGGTSGLPYPRMCSQCASYPSIAMRNLAVSEISNGGARCARRGAQALCKRVALHIFLFLYYRRRSWFSPGVWWNSSYPRRVNRRWVGRLLQLLSTLPRSSLGRGRH